MMILWTGFAAAFACELAVPGALPGSWSGAVIAAGCSGASVTNAVVGFAGVLVSAGLALVSRLASGGDAGGGKLARTGALEGTG